jgi:hypothetical protein
VVYPIDLASEMAAARQRHQVKTANLLREARVQAIRAAIRPGWSRAEVEECARSLYPRLNPTLLEEAISAVAPARDPEPEPTATDAAEV